MNDSLLSQLKTTEAKMAKRRYVIKLTAEERKQLEELIRKGKSSAKQQLKARILLQADESPAGAKWSDAQISEALGTYPVMCARVRRQWVEGGVGAVLSRKQRTTPPVPRIFDGEKEAKLIALACSKPPEGHAKWTLRLLENKVVELNIVDRASDNTIGRILKKTSSSLISNNNG
jgi:Homeodomain-like domain